MIFVATLIKFPVFFIVTISLKMSLKGGNFFFSQGFDLFFGFFSCCEYPLIKKFSWPFLFLHLFF